VLGGEAWVARPAPCGPAPCDPRVGAESAAGDHQRVLSGRLGASTGHHLLSSRCGAGCPQGQEARGRQPGPSYAQQVSAGACERQGTRVIAGGRGQRRKAGDGVAGAAAGARLRPLVSQLAEASPRTPTPSPQTVTGNEGETSPRSTVTWSPEAIGPRLKDASPGRGLTSQVGEGQLACWGQVVGGRVANQGEGARPQEAPASAATPIARFIHKITWISPSSAIHRGRGARRSRSLGGRDEREVGAGDDARAVWPGASAAIRPTRTSAAVRAGQDRMDRAADELAPSAAGRAGLVCKDERRSAAAPNIPRRRPPSRGPGRRPAPMPRSQPTPRSPTHPAPAAAAAPEEPPAEPAHPQAQRPERGRN
jgi:hypothetical protein